MLVLLWISFSKFDVPDEEIVKRMSGRRVHPGSGRVYHVIFNPPKVDGIDDVTGDALVVRADDEETTVRKRLDIYHQQTEPLADYHVGEAAAGIPAMSAWMAHKTSMQ